MTNAKPQGKANLIHQQVLFALLENKRGLAKNVSWQNVDAAAKRWSNGKAVVSESVVDLRSTSGSA